MAEEITLYMHAGVRGLAEKVRMLLVETGLRFNEVPVDKAGFEKLCSDGTLNFETLPMLKHGSKIIEDSANIMEYIAELADSKGKGSSGNLYCGKNEERVFVRAIAAFATDFQKALRLWTKEKLDKAAAEELATKFFTQVQRVLDKNDDGDARTEEWTYGKCFTYADLTLFEAISAFTEAYGQLKLRQFPKVKEFHDKVAGRARMVMHLGNRPPAQYL